MSTLIYLAGIVLAIVAVLDIVKKPIKTSGKIIASVILLLTSWVGLIIYYLYAKDHLIDWFK
ncbi:MAG: hypothetical protein II637_04030 [Bacteroidales bacterium]|nr:hypothetical protein [Bacteroidales bacterium]